MSAVKTESQSKILLSTSQLDHKSILNDEYNELADREKERADEEKERKRTWRTRKRECR